MQIPNMDDWQKDFSEIVEFITTGIEQIFENVSDTVEAITQELDEIFEIITSEIEVSIPTEIDQYVQEFFSIFVDNSTTENEIETQDLEDYISENQHFEEFSELSTEAQNKPNSIIPDHPACVGCAHYHGQFYGDNLLVCAMHPYGWDDQFCPDWEGYHQDSAYFKQDSDDLEF